MKEALILIDYTNDFVATGGALTAGEPAQAIDDKLAVAIAETLDGGGYVFVMNDLHYADTPEHPESALFPPHNLAGTPGREIYGKTGEVLKKYAAKKDDKLFYMDKFRYSSFAGTSLDILLRQFDIRDLRLTGVCTDICVLHTAVDAYNLGYHCTVHKSEVATFNPEGHVFALEHMRGAMGFKVCD